MLELRQGSSLLKKVLKPIKDLLIEANFVCSPTGFSLRAMDLGQVALVELLLRPEGFDVYRCDRNVTLGMNLDNMTKILKCIGNDGIVTIKADDDGDTVSFTFESLKQYKIDFKIKRMDIRNEDHMIPEELEYHAVVKMPSSNFARICRDLSNIGGETVVISVTVSEVALKFSIRGDIA